MASRLTPVSYTHLIAYLGSVGILVACLVALGSVEIMRISIEKGWTIHMPPSVPQVIENTFSTIFPYVYALILFYALSVISQLAFGKLLPELCLLYTSRRR